MKLKMNFSTSKESNQYGEILTESSQIRFTTTERETTHAINALLAHTTIFKDSFKKKWDTCSVHEMTGESYLEFYVTFTLRSRFSALFNETAYLKWKNMMIDTFVGANLSEQFSIQEGVALESEEYNLLIYRSYHADDFTMEDWDRIKQIESNRRGDSPDFEDGLFGLMSALGNKISDSTQQLAVELYADGQKKIQEEKEKKHVEEKNKTYSIRPFPQASLQKYDGFFANKSNGQLLAYMRQQYKLEYISKSKFAFYKANSNLPRQLFRTAVAEEMEKMPVSPLKKP